jgi:hypothetical protein
MVVRKAAQMAQVMKIPVIGLIENMSYFVCPDTGKRYDLFGMSHAETMAAQLGVPFLGRLPIDPEIARLCDVGRIEDYPIDSFKPMAERVVALASPAQQPICHLMCERIKKGDVHMAKRGASTIRTVDPASRCCSNRPMRWMYLQRSVEPLLWPRVLSARTGGAARTATWGRAD